MRSTPIKYPPLLEKLINRDKNNPLDVRNLLTSMGFKDADVVVDMNAEVGFLSIPAAEIVGPQGQVIAFNYDANLHFMFKLRMKPMNIAPMLISSFPSPLTEHIADHVLLRFPISYSITPPSLLKEAYRLLKTNHKLLILFNEKYSPDLKNEILPLATSYGFSHKTVLQLPYDQVAYIFLK